MNYNLAVVVICVALVVALLFLLAYFIIVYLPEHIDDRELLQKTKECKRAAESVALKLRVKQFAYSYEYHYNPKRNKCFLCWEGYINTDSWVGIVRDVYDNQLLYKYITFPKSGKDVEGKKDVYQRIKKKVFTD